MIENPTSLTEQILNLVERIATEMKALFATIETKAAKSHTHTIANITNLQTTLDSKASTSALNNKADKSHTHAISNVAGLQDALDEKADAADLSGKANASHTHSIANITNLQTTLNGKANSSHTHAISNVTGLQDALDDKADVSDLSGKANASHTHTTAQVSGLDSILAGKAPLSNPAFTGTIKGTLSGNASSATKLATKRTIDGVNFDGSANITHYGTCSTAAATAAKVVSCSNFALVTGARIAVKFTVTNSATNSDVTLNVNNTGAKPIYYRGSGTAWSASVLAANRMYEFVYTGSAWEFVGDIDTGSNNVGQTNTTTNAEYPVLFRADANTTSGTKATRFCDGVKINPSNDTITATTFKGTLSGNASSATKATQDGSGNTISSTYATKTEANGKIPKTGDAGTVSAYESVGTNTTMNDSSPGAVQISGKLTVSNGSSNKCWTKVARLTGSSPSVTLGSSWKWQGGSTPTLKQNCFVVCCWCGSGGIAIANNIS